MPSITVNNSCYVSELQASKTAVQCLGTCLYDVRGLKRSVIVPLGHQFLKTSIIYGCMWVGDHQVFKKKKL